MLERFIVALLGILAGVAASAQTPLDNMTESDLRNGESAFRIHCARCHGMQGEGGEGSNLARPRLRYANDDEAMYNLLAQGLVGTAMPAAWAISDEQRWQVAYYVRSLGRSVVEEMPGDPTAGKAIYEGKGACATCHIVAGYGTGIGPELTLIGDQRGLDYLRSSLDTPSQAQPVTDGYAEYLTVRAQTDYATVEGMRINEDAFSIQIRDLAGQIHSFKKSELRKFEKVFAHSLMPQYETSLSQNERDDRYPACRIWAPTTDDRRDETAAEQDGDEPNDSHLDPHPDQQDDNDAHGHVERIPAQTAGLGQCGNPVQGTAEPDQRVVDGIDDVTAAAG